MTSKEAICPNTGFPEEQCAHCEPKPSAREDQRRMIENAQNLSELAGVYKKHLRIPPDEKVCPDHGADCGKPPDTVYAHVERTVHALCAEIERRIGEPKLPEQNDLSFGIKNLAEAVQALSSWPQFNPMNAHEQYQQLAEYEVERAIKQQGIRISGGTTDAERTDVGSAFDMAFAKLSALTERIEKLERTTR